MGGIRRLMRGKAVWIPELVHLDVPHANEGYTLAATEVRASR